LSDYHNNSSFSFFGPMDVGVLVAVSLLMYLLTECEPPPRLARALDTAPAEDTADP
jgi:hypothetical protein